MRIAFNNLRQCVAQHDDSCGNDPAQHYRPDAFADLFAALKPDILCFAEVPFDSDNGQSAFLDLVSERLDLTHRFVAVGEKSWMLHDKWYGTAILSRWELTQKEVVPLANPGLSSVWADGKTYASHDKHAQRCVVATPQGPVALVTLHGYPFHRFKSSIVDFPSAIQNLASLFPADRLSCVCGDFNNVGAGVEALFPGFFGNGSFRNLVRFNAPDFVPGEPAGQIDYILSSAALSAKRTIVERGFSDHPVLVADIGI